MTSAAEIKSQDNERLIVCIGFKSTPPNFPKNKMGRAANLHLSFINFPSRGAALIRRARRRHGSVRPQHPPPISHAMQIKRCYEPWTAEQRRGDCKQIESWCWRRETALFGIMRRLKGASLRSSSSFSPAHFVFQEMWSP